MEMIVYKCIDNYFEYLLGDQGYTRLEKDIMQGFSKVERRASNLPISSLAKTFNKMYAGYKVDHME